MWTHFHPLTAFLPLSGAKNPLLSLVLEDGWAVYWLPQVSGEEESVKFKYAGILLHNLVLSSGRVTTNTRHMVDKGQGLNIKPLTSPTGLHVLSLRAVPPLLGIRY